MLTSIILAAGEGTRMKSKTSKVLHPIINKPVLEYILEACEGAGVEKNVILVGKNEERVRERFGDRAEYEKQEIGPEFPYGTGYAAQLGLKHIADEDTVVVLCGDTPLIREETIEALLKQHGDAVATVVTADLPDPSGYGRIDKDEEGNFLGIVEHKDCDERQLAITEINVGMYVFQAGELRKALEKIDTENAQGEIYLTDVFAIFREEGKPIQTFEMEDFEEGFGINSRVQLAEAEKIMQKRINNYWMQQGVTLENPDTIFIQKGVQIGNDTKICQNVKIYGDTVIGEDCLIESGSRIVDCKIGNGVKIYESVLEKSVVEDGADLGPFAHLRPKAHIGKKVHIGNFVEVKNATLGEGTKAGHLAYVGDADLGSGINIGCGAIFVNYDGVFKHRSVVKDGAFIGSNSNIIAPVTIEKEGYIAAGSTITKDVPEGVLAIERAEQSNIEGYVERKKKRDAAKKAQKDGK